MGTKKTDSHNSEVENNYETVVLTDEVWANCPENPWTWTSLKKWMLMSAVGLFGFLASVSSVLFGRFMRLIIITDHLQVPC